MLKSKKAIGIAITLVVVLINVIIGIIFLLNSNDDVTNEQLNIIGEVNKIIHEVVSDNSYKQLTTNEKVNIIQETLEQLATVGTNQKPLIKKSSIFYDEKSNFFSFEDISGALGGVVIEDQAKNHDIEIDFNLVDFSFLERKINTSFEQKSNIDTLQRMGTSIFYLSNSNINYNLNAIIMFGWEKWDVNSDYGKYYTGVKDYWQEKGVNATIQIDATVSDYKSRLQDNDLIIFATHGGSYPLKTGVFSKETYYTLCTTEEVTKDKNSIYKDDLNGHHIAYVETEEGNTNYWILPSFFDYHYKDNKLYNSFVYMNNCMGFGEGQIEDYNLSFAISNAGAETIVGYHNSVIIGYGMNILIHMVERLLIGDTINQSLNYAQEQEGYNDIGYVKNPKKDYMPAYPMIAGNAEKRLIDFIPSDNKQPDQSKLGGVSGTIKDGKNQIGCNGAIVTAYDENGEKADETKTNAEGQFMLDLKNGNYNIVIQYSIPQYTYEDYTFDVTIENSQIVVMMESILLNRMVVNERGNTVGNIVNGGFIAKSGDWIYYTQRTYNSGTTWSKSDGLYKIRIDGTENKKLCDNMASSITVIGDWIYYQGLYFGGNNLHKIRTDGTEDQILCALLDNKATFINVVGDWIYYITNSNIHKIRTDGTEETKLNNDESSYINVVGDWIYYCSYGNNSGIYKIRTDGTDKTKLNDYISNYSNVVEDWIYYQKCDENSPDDYYSLYKMRIDGTEQTQINNESSWNINVDGDWIYYTNDNNYLYKIKTDGTEKTQLNKDNCRFINVIGDWIYYYHKYKEYFSEKYSLYRIYSDGTEKQIIY